jgi:hypothetical protein
MLAMEDVMGKSGLGMVLNLAGFEQLPPDTLAREFDFASMAALNVALEEMYGPRGGRGLALRIGRSCFAQGMKSFGALAGVSDSAFKALPLESRCRLGLTALADIFTSFSDQKTVLNENDRTYQMVVEVSPMAWGRTADKPVCHALVGILQENLRWVSNGHEFYVNETQCRATGSETCVFAINKKPIGQA